jgi:hypothetical protein
MLRAMTNPAWPVPGSPEELAAFATLQAKVGDLYHSLARDSRQPQAVVIVPSLSMDPRELKKISGVYHYEERMLVNLMLLRQPRTKVIYVTSQKLDPVVVDYYLSLLPGVPYGHAKARLEKQSARDDARVVDQRSDGGRPEALPRDLHRCQQPAYDEEQGPGQDDARKPRQEDALLGIELA